MQDAFLICNVGEGSKAEHLPSVEDDQGVEDDSHGVVVDQRPPSTWCTSCQCLRPDYAAQGSPRDAFELDDIVDCDSMVHARARRITRRFI
jgi:hypothetical protein